MLPRKDKNLVSLSFSSPLTLPPFILSLTGIFFPSVYFASGFALHINNYLIVTINLLLLFCVFRTTSFLFLDSLLIVGVHPQLFLSEMA